MFESATIFPLPGDHSGSESLPDWFGGIEYFTSLLLTLSDLIIFIKFYEKYLFILLKKTLFIRAVSEWVSGRNIKNGEHSRRPPPFRSASLKILIIKTSWIRLVLSSRSTRRLFTQLSNSIWEIPWLSIDALFKPRSRNRDQCLVTVFRNALFFRSAEAFSIGRCQHHR